MDRDYPYEKHYATTVDGYEIMIHRIPNGHISLRTNGMDYPFHLMYFYVILLEKQTWL